MIKVYGECSIFGRPHWLFHGRHQNSNRDFIGDPCFFRWGTQTCERIKCLIFDDEMCTLQKVGGEDSEGRRVL